MRIFAISSLLMISMFVCISPRWCRAEGLPVSAMAQVKLTQQWLNSLDGKTVASIEKELGTPQTKKTWEFDGKMEKQWEYSSENPKYTLLLFFREDSVIKASLQVLSD